MNNWNTYAFPIKDVDNMNVFCMCVLSNSNRKVQESVIKIRYAFPLVISGVVHLFPGKKGRAQTCINMSQLKRNRCRKHVRVENIGVCFLQSLFFPKIHVWLRLHPGYPARDKTCHILAALVVHPKKTMSSHTCFETQLPVLQKGSLNRLKHPKTMTCQIQRMPTDKCARHPKNVMKTAPKKYENYKLNYRCG